MQVSDWNAKPFPELGKQGRVGIHRVRDSVKECEINGFSGIKVLLGPSAIV